MNTPLIRAPSGPAGGQAWRRLLPAAAVCALYVGAQPAQAATNLLVNGDFSKGAQGFQTDYAQASGSADSMWPEGSYTIGQDPQAVHGADWVSMSGLPIMMVNGSTSPGAVVWEEDGFTAGAGTPFTFSGKVVDLCCDAPVAGVNEPARIAFQFSTDGGASFRTVAQAVTGNGDAGVWKPVSGSFLVQPYGSFDVRVVDLSTAATGNDFGLADLSLVDPASAVPEPAAWAMMLLGVGMAGLGLRTNRRRAAAARAA